MDKKNHYLMLVTKCRRECQSKTTLFKPRHTWHFSVIGQLAPVSSAVTHLKLRSDASPPSHNGKSLTPNTPF